VFRLIGTWWPVALDSDENARASATDIARGTLGTADQNATPRRRMRDDLVDAARAAVTPRVGSSCSDRTVSERADVGDADAVR
jgi:plasmid stabilization system protein ParE